MPSSGFLQTGQLAHSYTLLAMHLPHSTLFIIIWIDVFCQPDYGILKYKDNILLTFLFNYLTPYVSPYLLPNAFWSSGMKYDKQSLNPKL